MPAYIQHKKRGRHSFLLLTWLILFFISQISCKEFIEVNPPITSLNAGNVYSTNATAAAVLTDIYAEMSAQNITLLGNTITSISVYAALAADELTLYDLSQQNLLGYYQNSLTKASQPNYWNTIYPQIFATNGAIAGLNASSGISPLVKEQLLGEAKFIRAFCYFYLLNLYGDVPLVLDLNYSVNALLSRTPTTQVYHQIITDLKEAQQQLSEYYLKGDALTPYTAGQEERVRPTKWAATALLARLYLYTGDYANAEKEANKVINHTALYSLTALNETFIKNSKEAIWQLQPVGNEANSNTGEGKLFILPTTGPNPSNPVYLSDQVIKSFEKGDLRRNNWIDSSLVNGTPYYYPYKYKIGNVIAPTQEYSTILRLAEQYLIRSEARARQNNITGAQRDLDIIRSRSGLPATTAVDKASLLDVILKERHTELFTEWGHRWFDLKRTQRVDAVMSIISPLKGGSWSPYKALCPIPQTDIDKNPNLVQNPGYN